MSPKRKLGRRTAAGLVLGVLIVVGIAAGGAAFTGDRGGVAAFLASEGISPGLADRYDRWAREYDPAEIQYLEDTKDPGFGDVSNVMLVGTMEMRETCRTLAAASQSGEPAAPQMTERLERLRQRTPPGSDSADFIYDAARSFDAGETWKVDQILRLDCADAIKFGTTRR